MKVSCSTLESECATRGYSIESLEQDTGIEDKIKVTYGMLFYIFIDVIFLS